MRPDVVQDELMLCEKKPSLNSSQPKQGRILIDLEQQKHYLEA